MRIQVILLPKLFSPLRALEIMAVYHPVGELKERKKKKKILYV